MTELRRFASRYPRAVAAVLLCCAVAALFIGGAQPFAVNLIPAPWDKFAHVAVFGAIGAALGIAIGIRRAGVPLMAAVGALAIGALDEWHQSLLPGRNAGWDDLAADAIGALVAAFVVHGLRAVARKSN